MSLLSDYISSLGLPKNGSVPTFDRVRKTSQTYKPTLSAIRSSSRGNVGSNGDVRRSLLDLKKTASSAGSRLNSDDTVSKTKNSPSQKETFLSRILA